MDWHARTQRLGDCRFRQTTGGGQLLCGITNARRDKGCSDMPLPPALYKDERAPYKADRTTNEISRRNPERTKWFGQEIDRCTSEYPADDG